MAAFFVSDDIKWLNRVAITPRILKGQPPASRKNSPMKIYSPMIFTSTRLRRRPSNSP